MPGTLTASLARYEVVVLEGCDGTGKTTLATALADWHDYLVVHSGRTPDSIDLAARYRAILATPGKVVLDRSFISELVYGPLDHGRSRLTITAAISLAQLVAARGGVLVHLTGSPAAILARLQARDGPVPEGERIRTIVDAYANAFARLGSAAPVVTIDTTAPSA